MSDQRRYIIEVLSPVHIGSGEQLSLEVDSYYDPKVKQTYVLDLDVVFAELGPDGFVGRIPRAEQLVTRLSQRTGALERACRHVLSGRLSATDLRLCLRDGRGCPLIPGSSIKGALRTAVICGLGWDFAKGHRTKLGDDSVRRAMANLGRAPQFAAGPLELGLLRPDLPAQRLDPREDPLRVLAVTDATFSAQTARVATARVSSPSQGDPRSLKQFPIALESISQGELAETRITLDKFLLDVHRGALGLDQLGLSWDSISSWTHDQALRLLSIERSHFERLGFDATVDEISGIDRAIRSAGEGTLPLRLGWGIGWTGTTGGLLEADERRTLVRSFGRRMSSHPADFYRDDRPFPKSRKLVGTEGDQGVFGWVLLREAGERRLPPPEPPAPVTDHWSASARPATKSAQIMAWSDRVLRQLAQMKRTEVAPQINGVYQRALSESQDPAEQLRVLRAIMNKLDEVGLLKRMSEGKKAKKWVLELLERIRLESE